MYAWLEALSLRVKRRHQLLPPAQKTCRFHTFGGSGNGTYCDKKYVAHYILWVTRP